MKKSFSLQVMAEIAIFAAIGFALDIFQSGLWRGVFANGGSIGIAMIPVLMISFKRGLVPGIICGLILSVLQTLGGVYVISAGAFQMFLQVSLDYLLAYTVVGFAGAFAGKVQTAQDNKARIKWVVIATVVGGMLKFLMHFLSGAIFWKNFDFAGGPLLYSVVYNGAYCLPNIIIAALILAVIAVKQPVLFMTDNKKGDLNEEN